MTDTLPYLGIDFGTSKSTMSWVVPASGQAEVIVNADGEQSTPSVVYFGDGNDVLVGTHALAMLDSDDRNERLRVVESIKRDLGKVRKLSLPGRLPVDAVEVAAAILKKLRLDAEKSHVPFNSQVLRGVVACPAALGVVVRDRLLESMKLAGFAEIDIIEEPVAAAIAFERSGFQLGKSTLVYDLGAGTFDVAVLVRDERAGFRLALPPIGENECGGDHFDQMLYGYCEERVKEKYNRNIDLEEGIDLVALHACRRAKERLSDVEQTTINLRLLTETGSIRFSCDIDRPTFEDLIADRFIAPTVRRTREVLNEAKERGHPVDTVVLVGGGSRIPLVRRMLADALPVEPREWNQARWAVSLGAAHYYLYRRQATEVTPVPTIVEPPMQVQPEPKPVPQPQAIPSVTATEPSPSTSQSWTSDWMTLDGHLASVNCVGFEPNSGLLFSGGADGTIRVWDTNAGKAVRSPLEGHVGAVLSLSFCPRRNLLASGGADGNVIFWDLGRGREVDRWVLREPVHGVAFNTDATLCAFVHPRGPVIVRDEARRWGKNEEILTSLVVPSLTMDPTGHYLACRSTSKVFFWDTVTRKHIGSAAATPGGNVAFNPNGRLLAIGSMPGQTNPLTKIPVKLPGRFYDIRDAALGKPAGAKPPEPIVSVVSCPSGALYRALYADESWGQAGAQNVAFSPDDQLLAASVNGPMRSGLIVWNHHAGARLVAGPWAPSCLAFSPDGSLFVGGHGDDIIVYKVGALLNQR